LRCQLADKHIEEWSGEQHQEYLGVDLGVRQIQKKRKKERKKINTYDGFPVDFVRSWHLGWLWVDSHGVVQA
jgi:hypothetical protein